MLAPDLPPHLEWLNTDREHSLKDFKGKFILLDFWTYCCLSCIHAIPELKKLEERYPELVVIGVHSAKFHNERVMENIRQAILRHDIEHPVIVDNNFEIWRTYDIDAWPSVVLIAPEGQIIGKAVGGGIFDKLEAVLRSLIEIYRRAGKTDPSRIAFPLLKSTLPETLLRFPGKVEAGGGRLFISDSFHNRIVVARQDGHVLDIIGSGDVGRSDGPFDSASFFRPQGLAFDDERDCLYIADTENHLIRKAKMMERTISTISGSCERGGPGIRTEVSLNSPWDLTIMGGWLYIAMAGSHQIWRIDLDGRRTEVYAGSGAEGILDGPRLTASLAQPSGITSDGRALYFVDSGSSSLRMISQDVVTTLVGRGLFIFGDDDGTFTGARLQHPIGILYHDGALYVADSYNHKIKAACLREREMVTLVGAGAMGMQDGDAGMAGLKEPGGLAFQDGRFYIADTNNHAIRIYDPEKGKVSTMSLGLSPGKTGRKVVLTERFISPSARGVHFRLELPEGYHWSADVEQRLRVWSEDGDGIRSGNPLIEGEGFSFFIPIDGPGEGRAVLKIEAVASFCGRGGLCCFDSTRFDLPLTVDGGAPKEDVSVMYKVLPA